MKQPADFAAAHYGPRAQDYVASEVHRSGADLEQIAAALQDRPDARVLDLGCGGGHVSYRVAALVREVVACDPTASMLDAVRAAAAERGLRNIRVQQAAAERLPFEDGAFDVVLSRFSTHHWRRRDDGLREARRVLKTGGLAIFVDTVAPEDALLDTYLQAIELLRDVSHVRNYRTSEWVAAPRRRGLRACLRVPTSAHTRRSSATVRPANRGRCPRSPRHRRRRHRAGAHRPEGWRHRPPGAGRHWPQRKDRRPRRATTHPTG